MSTAALAPSPVAPPFAPAATAGESPRAMDIIAVGTHRTGEGVRGGSFRRDARADFNIRRAERPGDEPRVSVSPVLSGLIARGRISHFRRLLAAPGFSLPGECRRER